MIEITYPNGLRVPLETLIRRQLVRIVHEGQAKDGSPVGGSYVGETTEGVAKHVDEIRICLQKPL